MLQSIKRLFSPAKDYQVMVNNGAVVIDVRSKGEYYEEHIPQAINIPFNRVAGKAKKLKALQVPVITCCRSGVRSYMAKRILRKSKVKAFNAGHCEQLKKQLNQL
jgi:phage shock protein E